MKVDIRETGKNERQIDLTVESADFTSELKSRLSQMRSKTDIKGFRKGKTPMSFIRRNYGKQVALEVITQKTNEFLNQAIKDNELDLINDPVLMKSSVPAIEDGKLEDDCEFTYVVGLMPDIELKGITSEDTYDYFELEVEEEKVNERLESMQKQLGEHTHPDDIQEHDVVEIEAVELDGDEPKEGGVSSTFRFATDLVADEELKQKVLDSKKGDSFDFNINEIEKERPEKYIREYFLKMEEGDETEFGDMFRATIVSVHRQVPAELDEEFFKKAFSEEVTTAEEAREEIGKQYKKGYAPVGDNLLLKELIERVESDNDIELPETYIHELLHQSGGEQHDQAALDSFRDNIKRQILISKMMKQLEIRVTQDDLRQKVMQEFASNFGGMNLPPETLDKIIGNALQDEKYVNELSDRVLNEKLIAGAKELVSLNIHTEEEEVLMKRYEDAFPRKSDEEE